MLKKVDGKMEIYTHNIHDYIFKANKITPKTIQINPLTRYVKEVTRKDNYHNHERKEVIILQSEYIN